MSAAHLHAVPDPDDAPAPAPAGVQAPPGETPAVVELLDAVPAPPGPADQHQAAEPGEELEGLDTVGEPGEEAPSRRALALPDLRPYVTADRATVAELGALAADVQRTTTPRIRRGLAPVLRAVWQFLRAGAVVVVLVLRGWFSGELAPKVPPLWRLLLGPLLVLYVAGQAVVLYPWAPLLLVPAWPMVALIAQWWATGQADRAAKAKASGKGGKGSSKETSKEAGKGAEKPSGKASTKGGKASGKGAPKTFATRLAAALTPPSTEPSPKAPAEASPEPAAEPTTEPAEETVEKLEEAPPAPSRDDIVRALHALVGGSSGVLHTALRDRLRYPSTRAVREALDAAGIPSRPGVRAVGGNGPGVNRRDFPPLPPPREGSPGDRCSRSSEPFTNNNNTGEGSREGLAVDGSDQEPAYPFDVVPDPEGGPSAWRIIPHK